MPKTISANMQTHLDGKVTSLASCIAVERRDGVRLFFTDHDQDIDLSVDAPFTESRFSWMNTAYISNVGYTRSATESASGNIDNSEVEAILSSEYVQAEDIRSGKYDLARVYMFQVNWNDLSDGVIRMPGSGWIGEITLNRNKGTYSAELRGLGQAFVTRMGEIYSPGCRTDLFSRRCGLPEQYQTGVITAITDNRTFEVDITPAGFSSTALTITNHNFETGGALTDPNIPGWTGVESHGAQWHQRDDASNPVGTDGDFVLRASFNTPHDVNRLFTIWSDAATIPTGGGGQPSTADIDAGLVTMELTVDISRRTGTTADDATLGMIFLDGSGDEITRMRSQEINDIQHGLTTSFTTYVREFPCPPNTRSIRVEIGAINKEGTETRVRFDDVRVNAIPTPALALGTDRDATPLADWFDNGLIVMRSGANDTQAMEIDTYDDSVTPTVTLYLPFPEDLAVGDVFEIYPGCKKRWTEDCATKWDNAINFQGEPFVPSQDEAFRTPDAK